MIETLKRFATDSLFEATKKLLAKWNLPTQSGEGGISLPAKIIFDSIPQHLADALQSIENIYFPGYVNDLSLTGVSSGDSSEQVLENLKSSNARYNQMPVFACDAKSDASLTRTTISTLTRAFNRISGDPVILLIRQGNKLNISTCERTNYSQFWRNGVGEKMGKVSILRDIDCINPHRGHIDILSTLGEKKYTSFDELYNHWMKVFSSELLTKKFYSELSDWYAWAVQIVRFPNDLKINSDDDKHKDRNTQEACIRLITRLIFVWFLKQKHLIPDEFFDEQYIKDNLIANFDPHTRRTLLYNAEESKYYRLILQNLFFAMLNCPIVAEGKTTPNNRRFRVQDSFQGCNKDYNINNLMRYEKEFMDGGAAKLLELANKKVPFLNGGLFECLDDKTNRIYQDGFSEHKDSLSRIFIPDYLFFGEKVGSNIDLSKWYEDPNKKSVSVRGLVDILKKYCFTIEENTPLDQEVSLDPELLGKSFENLLASFNEETHQSARKQTGSFYTPREIVQYMVNESIIAHLNRICGKENEHKYRNLLEYSTEEVTLTDQERMQIMRAIYDCRVLDPACGSGAFPMGVLQQMVHILKRIDPSNKMWNEMMVSIAVGEAKKELSKVAAGNNAEKQQIEDNRQARLNDIENAFNQSINYPDYARKLYLIERCIYGVDIQPIATQISKLRFFISLVVDQKPTKDAKTNFGIRPLPNLESKFVTANTLIPLDRGQNIFTVSDEILKCEDMLRDINHRIFLSKSNKEKSILKESMINTRRNMAKSLENGGYISTAGFDQLCNWDMFNQNASAPFFDPEWMFGIKEGFDIVIGNPPFIQLSNNEGLLADLYENVGYKTFARTGDIYCLFYELGHRVLKRDGLLCYITSNKWMRAAYGKKTRAFFLENINPIILIDFAGVKIFESASVDTNILLYSNGINQHKTRCAITNKKDANRISSLSDFVQHNGTICDFSSDDSWVILSPIEQSIKRKIESMGKPLKDWDINIYRGVLTGYNEAFIISTEKRDEILNNCADEEERARTEALIRPILRGRDIKRYGYDWADLWLINTHNGIKGKIPRIVIDDYPAVKSHLDQYWAKISKRADKGATPYNLRNCAYLEDFDKPKIMFAEIVQSPRFYLDVEGFYPEATTFMMNGENIEYLCNIFNSRIVANIFKMFYAGGCLGEKGYRYKKAFFERLPIPRKRKEVTTRIDDDYIQDAYGLTDEEMNYISSQL